MIYSLSRALEIMEDDRFNLLLYEEQRMGWKGRAFQDTIDYAEGRRTFEKIYNDLNHDINALGQHQKGNAWREWEKMPECEQARASLLKLLTEHYSHAEWSKVPVEAGSKRAPTKLRSNGDRVRYLPVDQTIESFRRAEQWLEEHCK